MGGAALLYIFNGDVVLMDNFSPGWGPHLTSTLLPLAR